MSVLNVVARIVEALAILSQADFSGLSGALYALADLVRAVQGL